MSLNISILKERFVVKDKNTINNNNILCFFNNVDILNSVDETNKSKLKNFLFKLYRHDEETITDIIDVINYQKALIKKLKLILSFIFVMNILIYTFVPEQNTSKLVAGLIPMSVVFMFVSNCNDEIRKQTYLLNNIITFKFNKIKTYDGRMDFKDNLKLFLLVCLEKSDANFIKKKIYRKRILKVNEESFIRG